MSDFDAMKLDNQLCFPLYACSREVIKLYRPYLDPLELTYTQYITMLVIWEHKKISARDLGLKLYLDSGTLTPVLKHLESKGLITRRRSKDDERILLVKLTAKGEAMQEEAAHIPLELAKCVKLEPQEARQLHALLYKLLAQSET